MTDDPSLSGLRVLMTADTVGGVWTYALDLAHGLADRGISITLASLGPPANAEQHRAAAGISGLDLVETGLPLDWTATCEAEILESGAALADLAREIRADLVHLNGPALAAGGAFSAPVLGACHSCVATWWAAVHGTALPADLAWRADLVRRGYGRADALVAPSAAFARATADTYGIAAPIVVQNGRGPTPEAAPTPTSATVLTAGRLWDEGKGVALLDRAAARMSTPVVAAGSTAGPNSASISPKHIQSLGHLPAAALGARMAARPIFASLARYEPFGLAILEAGAVGCPLVLSDIPTFRELWDGAALFVDEDEALVAAALDGLAGDPVARARLGEAARRRAADYTAERMVNGIAAIYANLLGAARGRDARSAAA